MWPLYLTNLIIKHTKEVINTKNLQILNRSDAQLLNIKKLVKLIVSLSKAALRFMAPENPV